MLWLKRQAYTVPYHISVSLKSKFFASLVCILHKQISFLYLSQYLCQLWCVQHRAHTHVQYLSALKIRISIPTSIYTKAHATSRRISTTHRIYCSIPVASLSIHALIFFFPETINPATSYRAREHAQRHIFSYIWIQILC